ncbi:homeotic protein empty spiracles X1 [Biomphalaria glabrata]|nr:homeotic protein empty spiracles X1 [Biomphalaria glabrata]
MELKEIFKKNMAMYCSPRDYSAFICTGDSLIFAFIPVRPGSQGHCGRGLPHAVLPNDLPQINATPHRAHPTVGEKINQRPMKDRCLSGAPPCKALQKTSGLPWHGMIDRQGGEPGCSTREKREREREKPEKCNISCDWIRLLTSLRDKATLCE